MPEETCGLTSGPCWKQYVCALVLCGPLYICSYVLTETSFFAGGFVASNMNSEFEPNDDMQRMGRGS
jgi:hypothetical protein